MYPDPNVPRHGKSLYKPYISWVVMGKLSPQSPYYFFRSVHPVEWFAFDAFLKSRENS